MEEMFDITDVLKDMFGKDEYRLPDPVDYTYWKARQNRTFYIDYEIMDDYTLIELSKVIVQMNMEEKDIPKEELKPIYIWCMSYGGDLDQAQFFCDLLISSRIPIITVAMGVAMSAGFLIFLAGHRRYMFKNTQLLVHQGSISVGGSAEEATAFMKNYKKQLDRMKAYIVGRTEIDSKTFTKNQKKDWYLTDEDAVKYKIVDKVIDNIEDIF